MCTSVRCCLHRSGRAECVVPAPTFRATYPEWIVTNRPFRNLRIRFRFKGETCSGCHVRAAPAAACAAPRMRRRPSSPTVGGRITLLRRDPHRVLEWHEGGTAQFSRAERGRSFLCALASRERNDSSLPRSVSPGRSYEVPCAIFPSSMVGTGVEVTQAAGKRSRRPLRPEVPGPSPDRRLE